MLSPQRVTGLKHDVVAQQGDLIAFNVGNHSILNGNLAPISELIALRKRLGRQRLAQPCITSDGRKIFVKTSSIESYPSRLRISLGLKRRSGAYDWPLAELRNSVRANQKTDMIPKLIGFGLAKGKSGLTKEVFLTFENQEDHIDGFQWAEKHPEQIDQLIRASVDSIVRLNSFGIYHLDLWAGNIMFPVDSFHNPRVIDLENCFIGPTKFHEETLGYQLALFYQHSLGNLISEQYYDEIIRSHINTKKFKREQFQSNYQKYKHKSANRKNRFLLPLTGNLP